MPPHHVETSCNDTHVETNTGSKVGVEMTESLVHVETQRNVQSVSHVEMSIKQPVKLHVHVEMAIESTPNDKPAESQGVQPLQGSKPV